MKTRAISRIFPLLLCVLLLPTPAPATDVDGPDDCVRVLQDFGDAPEGVKAYPGVIGCFPTCLTPGPIGTQQFLCGTPVGPAPGPAGYVEHAQSPGASFWLGCVGMLPPLGIDSEPDGKVNDDGSTLSACSQIPIDCVEAAFGLSFGQDECYGSDDAGVLSPVTFQTCTMSSVGYRYYSCAQTVIPVYLNVLVDWNQDGDWCDAFPCPGGCAYEWAVQNFAMNLMPGCVGVATPQFLSGPFRGPGWMRITISSRPVPPDFPWNGTVSLGGPIQGGETEDYPITIEGTPQTCPEYLDYGDAPEDTVAYPSGAAGHFPTCTYFGAPGTQEVATGCQVASPPPARTGHVLHRQNLGDVVGFWLGCWQPYGVDTEIDGKMNSTGAPPSACNPSVRVDCIEPAFGGMNFGQDECTGDGVDAGLRSALTFQACQSASVTFDAYNCESATHAVVLNILVDWNEDGDWNDVVLCPGGQCVPEWAVQNASIVLAPGCQTLQSPVFLAGPRGGVGWMRITLTESAVPPDFPWNGSLSMPTGEFEHGETEDYPVVIEPMPDPCPEYRDFGDAPEDAQAYPGVRGFFPTCRTANLTGTQELAAACPAISVAPGPTGFVEHNRVFGAPLAFWLGCWQPGVDAEFDGKMNDTGVAGSACTPAQLVDCIEAAFGLNFGQDECYADGLDAGVQTPLQFTACQRGTVTFDAMNCGAPAEVYLNVLVDWNQDGDWNDSFWCTTVGCAYEWAVKNALVTLPNGCTTLTSPAFLAGPHPGDGWLRITLSEQPAPDDFPWNGTVSVTNQAFAAGETEDYPVTILGGHPCEEPYIDYGDAPEHSQAYPGVPGRFPTCLAAGLIGDQILQCGLPLSTPPGPAGFVRHVWGGVGIPGYWLGCPDMVSGFPGVDSELDGKTNDTGAPPSICDPSQLVDCVEPMWLSFGQDECVGDLDAGVTLPYRFPQCTLQRVQFLAYSCGPQTEAILNVLVDWNQDGDWNDNILCPYTNFCAPEWVVKNLPILLQPGCAAYSTPPFRVGPSPGPGWMRVTLSQQIAPDDFPWNGTLSLPGEQFEGGETEDYPIEIVDSPIGVTDAPLELALAPPVPNPARGTTALRFTVPVAQEVTLAAYDVQGRRVRALRSGQHSAGIYNVTWDFTSDGGSRLPAGVYLVTFTAGDRIFTQRVIHLR